jgi:uncharacterized integral membrane protein
MLPLYALFALAFAIVIALFAAQNTTSASVSLLAWHTESMSISVLILIAAALGAAITLVLGIMREISLRLHNRGTSQRLRAAEARVKQLEAQVHELEAERQSTSGLDAAGSALPAGDPPPAT